MFFSFRFYYALAFLGLGGCAGLPLPKAGGRNANIEIRGDYASGRAAVPEMVSSLSAVFGGRALRSEMERAQKHNPDLAEAAAVLEEAGFNTRSARSGLFPSISGNGGAVRSQSNSSGAGFSAGTFITERFTGSLDAEWEVDVWGRIRAGVAAERFTTEAASADYAAASQSIAAQTAQGYFNLVAATKLGLLAEERFSSFQSTVDLLTRRFELGTADLGDVSLAETDLENARAEIYARKDERDQAARELAVLTGSYPDASRGAGKWPSLKRGVASGIPSTLLEVRPDIFAAYQRILAADENVKVAHRDLFPSFTLTASGGQQSSVLSDFLDSNFSVWAIAGNLVVPIIDGGEKRAELAAASARGKQAVASYRATVLNAFREVENALGSELYLKKQEEATVSAVAVARSAEERSLRNFESGLIEILDVLETKRRRFTAEEALINLKNARYQNRVSLALALGKAY